MRIKRLNIQGFKSFADQVVVNFDDGITGVVGPNGCGKSNIVDALRWVMGEQNAKHLRGGNMQDIIFNGASTRGPMGYAEVSLILENTNPEIMPEEYSAFSEIQVTRRLYRTGESEYEINKQDCRLKDITEFFLGTGVGTKAYSIIEQGQVSKIISAKPEDRRHMIEEAAGITKYKAKRMAAERRMDATRHNLERVTDIKSELESRMNSLERQAKKAERFKRMQVELKEMDLHHSTLKYLEHHAQLRLSKSEAERLENSISTQSGYNQENETAITHERQLLTEAEKELSLLKGNLYEVENAIALAKKDISYVSENASASQERTSQIHDEVTKLHEKQSQLSKEFEKTKFEQQEYIEKLKVNEEKLAQEQALFDEAESKRNSAYSALENARNESNENENRIIKNETLLESYHKEAHGAETRLEEIAATFSQITEEAAGANESLSRLTEQIASKEDEVRKLKNSASTTKQALADLNTKQKAVRTKKNELSEKLASTRGKLSSLQEIEANLVFSGDVQKRVLDKDSNKISGIVAQLVKAPSELEEILEIALSKYLDAFIASSKKDASEIIESINAEQDGRATVFVHDKDELSAPFVAANCEPLIGKLQFDEKYQGSMRAIFSKWHLAQNAESAFSVWEKAKAKGIHLLTLSGEVFSPDGFIQSGHAESSSGILKRKRLIVELGRETDALCEAIANSEAEKEHLRKEYQTLSHADETASSALKSLEYELIRLTANKETFERDINRAQQQKAKLESEQQRLVQVQEKLQNEESLIKSALEDAKEQTTSLKNKVFEFQNELKGVEQNFAKFNASLSSIRAIVGHEQERRDHLDRNIRRIENEQSDARNRLELLLNQQEDLSQKIVELANKKEEASKQIEIASEEKGKIEGMLEIKHAKYDEAAKRLEAMELSISSVRQQLDEQRERLNQLTIDIKEHEIHIATIDERLLERYKISLFDAINDFHHLELPEDNLQKNIQTIQKSLDNMGNINLNAQEEYTELSDRFEFLETQSNDLTGALQQLESAINKINHTTEARFKEAFDAINNSFTKVFPRLFKGGAAWLALTEPSDLLNTGVEIFAQPPGKKLASIALMSGGEKALTATSLIFAIFLIKPSPFCLLDEVDAPLDESNVTRFSQLVKEMSSQSQFILITHNKRTMEVIDHLYGITMQEAGVSKMVHVHVKDMESIENSGIPKESFSESEA